jgi:hypothetical protein
MLPPLEGDLGDSWLSDLLATFTRTEFYDTDHNYRWLSTDSENYEPDYRFADGYVMEGGFFTGIPNVVPAIASYQLQQNTQADQYANDFYLDVWTRMGPYETMRQWDTTPAGMYLEASIYMEPLVGTWWLLEEALGLSVDGTTVTVEPRLGGQFVARNARVTASGLSAVFDYARDELGEEYIQITSNDGLTIYAPQAEVYPTHTSTNTPTAAATTTATPTATPTPAPAESGYQIYLPLVLKPSPTTTEPTGRLFMLNYRPRWSGSPHLSAYLAR